ncbi:PCI domain RNA export protein [Acrasis kona]|uniref:PCI domain RNA export protein n=1 Tax=Acrasis kona TaxID=1008807 RepID=A0AAW2YMQ5_9EUKA
MNQKTYISTLNALLVSQNGPGVSSHLEQEFRNMSCIKSPTCDLNSVDGDHREFIKYFVEALVHSKNQQHTSAFEKLSESFKIFVDKSFVKGAVWTIPVIKIYSKYVRLFAESANKVQGARSTNVDDDEQSSSTEGPLGIAARQFMEVFRKVIPEKSELKESRKWVLLDIINNLLRIYFKLNTLRMCKNVIQPVESSTQLPPFEGFSTAEKVTYKYYAGRFAMYESDFVKARERLQYAFTHCHPGAENNKRMTLRYLICVNLVIGCTPKQSLLTRYGMDEFSDLVKGYRVGNLKLFQESLDKHQMLFIRKGIYLILDKAKIVVFRNLFKNIAALHKDPSRLPLKNLKICLDHLGYDMDVDEVECMMSVLIYKGYIKGYLSHAKQTAVLGKKNAFPALERQHISD